MNHLTDILLIIPLKEEFDYIKSDVFKDFQPDSYLTKVFPNLKNLYRFKHPGSKLDLCAVVLNEMSNEASTLISERYIKCLKPRLVIGIGISGRLKENILLGDVIISKSVCNYLSESKAIDIKKHDNLTEIKIQTSSVAHAYPVEDKFIAYFQRPENFVSWQKECESALKNLNLVTTVSSKRGKQKSQIAHEKPEIVVGNIASGPIVGASEILKNFLDTVERKFHAIEMEGAGIAYACRSQFKGSVDFILFRGISDFADIHKTNLEEKSKNGWRNLAASNAARLVNFCLNDENFKKLLKPHTIANKPLNIALFLSAHVHYIDSITAGFQNELAKIYAETEYWPHIVQMVDSPNANDNEENQQKLKNLVTESSPEYIVTIGTAATKAAFNLYKNARKIIFLGVSEPEKAGFTGSGFIAGVSYGVAINETVELLQEAFPKLIPTFVHNSSNIYSQDNILLEALRERYNENQVPKLELNSPVSFEDQGDRIYFGRFFLCKNMRKFTELNPDKPFVGVSIENIMKGAILSIGYDTLEIGRIGARDILASNHLAEINLNSINVINPKQIVIGHNRSVANKVGHQVCDEFRVKLTHVFD